VILRPPGSELDPRVRRYWATWGLVALLAAVAVTVAATVVAWSEGGGSVSWALLVLTLGVTGLGIAALAIVPGRAYRLTRYEVTDQGLYVSRGWLVRRWQVIPHARVQAVDTTSGPMLRAFGLVRVDVRTASAEGTTKVSGLDRRVADRVVRELAHRAGLEEGA